jgi:exosortase/archaeosortase family protein
MTYAVPLGSVHGEQGPGRGKWTHEAQDLWRHASPRTRTTIQVAVVLCAVAVAYNYSLLTLLQNATLDTPLAYVSLVPFFALALAAIRARPLRSEPEIHDRQLDYIVGVPLIAAAVAAEYLLPSRLSAMFWVWRVDLLTLPFFVAGCVALIFGVRVLWREKLAVGFLLLAWPFPYQTVLLRVLDGFTRATLEAIEAILKVIPVATPVSSPNGPLFLVVHDGHSFPLSIVSACSGVNSVVGFLLVGSAFAVVVRGPIVRKTLWLIGGMAMIWWINLERIVFIFWAGRTWGENVALNVLHPFIGLVLFSIGVLLMVLFLEPLGMEIAIARPAPKEPPPKRPPKRTARKKAAVAVPKVYLAILVVLASAAVLGINNLGLKAFNLVADASGQPKLDAYITAPVGATGWDFRRVASFDWAKPLFGDSSVWDRYVFRATDRAPLFTSSPVVADVIVTPDLASFSAYGVEACYQFHGYALRDVAQVGLGGGITGQSMSYTSAAYGSWSIVYWIIPVKMGTTSTYERVVLYVQNHGSGVQARGITTPSGIQNVAGSLTESDVALIRNRDFLVAFARELIGAEAARSGTGQAHSNLAVGTR